MMYFDPYPHKVERDGGSSDPGSVEAKASCGARRVRPQVRRGGSVLAGPDESGQGRRSEEPPSGMEEIKTKRGVGLGGIYPFIPRWALVYDL